MQSLLIQSAASTRDVLIAELWECGTTGIIEDSDTVRAFFETDSVLPQVLNRLSCPVLEVRSETTSICTLDPCQNRDGIYAGRNFFIVSSGVNNPTPIGRRRLVIDAADAFGSGSHESTQLIIQALEQRLPVNATVVDVGCGSGVLSAVAQALGAAQVIACDIHMGAIQATRKHSPSSFTFLGSVDAVAPAVADVTMVNIGASIIDLLVGELYRIVKPNSLLILAGFTSDRTPTKIHPQEVIQLNDWLCWLCHLPLSPIRYQAQQVLQPFPAKWW